MATIVLVHGINQSLKAADTLEGSWIPALAGGIRNSGHPDLADRIWRNQQPGDLTVRMAFYGNLFRTSGAQGDSDLKPATPQDVEIEQQLARAWLEAAAERAADPTDRAAAKQAVTQLTKTDGAQGVGAVASAAVRQLAGIRWFAPVGFAFAERFVKRPLREVSLYLTDPAIREAAQQRVLDLVDHSTRLVIGHSLGSVVAYEALHRTTQPVTLITCGSPLALRTIIYERLQPQPPTVPPAVTSWADFADREDLIAVHLELGTDFPPPPGSTVDVTPTVWVNNGAHAHDENPYLTEAKLGQAATNALNR